MPLPILQSHADPTPSDLLRYFARAQLHWARHVGEEAALDAGTAFTNAELAGVPEANRVIDASLPDGTSVEQAMAEVTTHFTAANSTCQQWEMNPAAAAAQTQPLADALLATGHVRDVRDVLYLKRFPTDPLREAGGLRIIPARASFRHVRELAEESARSLGLPKMPDAKLLHLDDPHTDALLALRDGVALAFVAVLSVGEIGAIQDLYVAEAFRRQGLGVTMMSRALEIAARSLFKHVFVSMAPENAAAISLFYRGGFEKIGEAVSYRLAR